MKTTSPCACVTIRRASRAITQFYDNLLEPSGLKVTQLSLLRAVQRLDNPNISALAEELQLDRTTLGRNVLVLQRAGLVNLSPGDDQRERTVHLTVAGDEALVAAAPLWDEAQARIVERLGDDRLELLNNLLADLASLAD